jgi:hypothetical protein
LRDRPLISIRVLFPNNRAELQVQIGLNSLGNRQAEQRDAEDQSEQRHPTHHGCSSAPAKWRLTMSGQHPAPPGREAGDGTLSRESTPVQSSYLLVGALDRTVRRHRSEWWATLRFYSP